MNNRILSHDELRAFRVEVFRQTVQIARDGVYRVEDNEYVLPEADVRRMQTATRFYWREFRVDEIPAPYTTRVEVRNIDSLVAGKELQDQGYRVAVLNMASRRNPGGGVVNGSGAQEENLFRRSNLFQSLYQYAPFASQYGVPSSRYHYPLDPNFGGIYTPDATVFRGTEQERYPLIVPYKMSFISVAGINRPDLTPDGWIVPDLVETVKHKMRTIFRLGLAHHRDALVLGAFGCGAFRNPPRHIARLFREVMEEPEFKGKYKYLCFAILEDQNSGRAHNPEGNFRPFREELG